jgi:hypothetical protein
MAGFRLQEGNLFIHSTNPVFAVSPFPIVALPNPALEFALQKFERHIRDERSLKEVFEQFEYISHSSHRFSIPFHAASPSEILCRSAKHHNFLIAHCVDLSQFPRYFASRCAWRRSFCNRTFGSRPASETGLHPDPRFEHFAVVSSNDHIDHLLGCKISSSHARKFFGAAGPATFRQTRCARSAGASTCLT